MKEVFQAFRSHTQNPATIHEQFWHNGSRYVICDKCGKLTDTSDCMYYGGEGIRIFAGGCRKCFSERKK